MTGGDGQENEGRAKLTRREAIQYGIAGVVGVSVAGVMVWRGGKT